MKHEAKITRTPFTKQYGYSYNKFRPEDGILLEFKTENGTHYIRLNRESVEELARGLASVEQEWKSAMYAPDVCGE